MGKILNLFQSILVVCLFILGLFLIYLGQKVPDPDLQHYLIRYTKVLLLPWAWTLLVAMFLFLFCLKYLKSFIFFVFPFTVCCQSRQGTTKRKGRFKRRMSGANRGKGRQSHDGWPGDEILKNYRNSPMFSLVCGEFLIWIGNWGSCLLPVLTGTYSLFFLFKLTDPLYTCGLRNQSTDCNSRKVKFSVSF